DAGRADGAQPGGVGRRGRRPRPVRRGADRRRRGGHPHRRGPAPLQGRHGRDRPVRPPLRHRLLPGGGRRRRRGDQLPAHLPTVVEYQMMRDAAFACIRRIGVVTGGSNIQFAVSPAEDEMVVIEMNPRVSRSSALSSKATGFPIAKIAAKLAVGYRLDEVMNDITRETPASFEPAIDYCVVKFPRWAFEKFPEADRTLTTQMKSVG